MAKRDLAIGIDLGGTNIAAGVVDRKGKLLGRAKKKTKAVEGRESVLSRLVTAMEDACTEAGVSLADVSAVFLWEDSIRYFLGAVRRWCELILTHFLRFGSGQT